MSRLAAALTLAALLAGPRSARAEGSYFSVAIAGGALVPRGAMEATAGAGLDVWGRFGWTAKNGLGLALHLEYAPLRRVSDALPEGDSIDTQLFVAQAAPRFTLGRHVVRAWLAPAGGVLVDRTATTTTGATAVRVETAWIVGGQGGVDLYFFERGGVTFAGGYTRGLAAGTTYDYLSLSFGLMLAI